MGKGRKEGKWGRGRGEERRTRKKQVGKGQGKKERRRGAWWGGENERGE